jgi:hypothetical protein
VKPAIITALSYKHKVKTMLDQAKKFKYGRSLAKIAREGTTSL